jgi:hypothetical protein
LTAPAQIGSSLRGGADANWNQFADLRGDAPGFAVEIGI